MPLIMTNPKLIRVTTIDESLESLFKGQLRFLNQYFEVVGVSDDSGRLHKVAEREGIRTVAVTMHREINLCQDVKSLWQLIKLFRQEKPYIVHANTPKASLLSMVAAFVVRVPNRIYTVTGLRFETTTGLFRCILKTMERITCLCATKVIPEGDGVRDTLYREHITRKPLQKILNGNINGIDIAHFEPNEELQQKAAVIRKKDSKFTFIFIGRIVKDKGISELIAAFKHVKSLYPTVNLLLVGRFEDELDPVDRETKEFIETASHVQFVGYQSDVRPYLLAADALVFPSYREGFPNVVMQAGAMGLPSIVTDINGCNEIIIDGKNGTIIPSKDEKALLDAMKSYVENKDTLVRSMAAKSRAMITSRYDQKDVWTAILKEYQTL